MASALRANSDAEFRIEDMAWRHNEMRLQGLNLSSTEVSVLNHDLALLQLVMNAGELSSILLETCVN